MMMPGRKWNAANSYRYGFNGKENDNEVKGEGNQQDYGMRIYDPRVGKFLSVDPLTKEYPWYTPYQFAGNEPISNIDLDGLEKYKVTVRTFLPYTYVWEPQAKVIIDKANTRWYPQYKNVEAHGGFKSEQQFEIDFYAGTATYISPFTPGTYSKNIVSDNVQYFKNPGLGDSKTSAGIFDQKAKIYAEIATKNPATPDWMPTPAIDYELNISILNDGTWTLGGTWDGFPALEIFLEDLETGKVDLIHFDNTSDAGKDLKDGKNPEQILNLFPANPWANNGDVKINKVGQMGNNQQKDQETPSPKVEENNKRFSKPLFSQDKKPENSGQNP